MDAETNAILVRYEISRRANELSMNMGIFMEILEDCFKEVSDRKVTEDRMEVLQDRFELITSIIRDKAMDFVNISKEVSLLG